MPDPDVVIVTGAAGNLGAAVCAVLSGRGSRVVAVARDEAELRARLAAAGSPAPALIVAVGDLTDPAAAELVAAEAARVLGRIDGLAHTVGGFTAAPLGASDPALWERMHRLNLLTTLNMFRAVLPRMQQAGRGSVVAIGAGAAQRAPSGLSAYAAAKAAVLRLVESAADEMKKTGIRANAVLPGIIDTPQNRAAMPGADTSRWVTPVQVADVIAFLLSAAASGVTGAAVPVSGRG